MSEVELRLNDFKGFDRYLFGEGKPDWSQFYGPNSSNIFHPPIAAPQTLEEYQLCHYTLWMVISTFDLRRKPIFIEDSEIFTPISRCYPCTWKMGYPGSSCVSHCPLDIYPLSYRIPDCGKAYQNWINSECDNGRYAYEIAHYRWRRV